VQRFISNTRNKIEHKRNRGPFLQLNGLRETLTELVKQSQCQRFTVEIEKLQCKQQLSKNSPLAKLRPFIDLAGVFRFGGRLTRYYLKYCQRHPVILHHKDRLTHFIVRQRHRHSCHAGPTLLMGEKNSTCLWEEISEIHMHK